MFCDRKINNKINYIHEESPGVASKDTTSEFETLLHINGAIFVQLLMIEVYRTKSDLCLCFMNEILTEKNIIYQLRNECPLVLPRLGLLFFGLESISYLGNRLWQKASNEMKESSNLSIFKEHIKSWKIQDCNCKFYKKLCPLIFLFLLCE